MERKSDLYYLFKDLTDALKKKIDSRYIFEGRRPDVSSERMTSFVVIELNVGISDLATGGKGFHFVSGASFRLFVKAKKDCTLNVEKTSDLAEEIVSLFPIRGVKWAAIKPMEMLVGYDGYGFHEVRIPFSIYSK